MAWVRTSAGWRHRPWWKVVVNTVLRRLQPDAVNKWVIYTVCTVPDDPDEQPETLTYGFGPIPHNNQSQDDG